MKNGTGTIAAMTGTLRIPDYQDMSVAAAMDKEPRLQLLLFVTAIDDARSPAAEELDLRIQGNHPDYPAGDPVPEGSDAVVLLEGTVIINDYSPTPLYWTVQEAKLDAAPELTLMVYDTETGDGRVPNSSDMPRKIKKNHPNSPPGDTREVGGTVGVIIL